AIRRPGTLLGLVVDDAAATVFYSLSLHDALPISGVVGIGPVIEVFEIRLGGDGGVDLPLPRDARLPPGFVQLLRPGRPFVVAFADRKSTRLNSSHVKISYAVFCLKKKNIHALMSP